jgi:fructose-bisphosphate aldolase class I
MKSIIAALLVPGKGLLAADESLPTIARRFQALDIAVTERSRRAYRELLFTAPRLREFISGVILFDETLRQRTDTGVPFPELLAAQGMIPGIKVDKGTTGLPGFRDEKMTEGLDGLRGRLSEYRKLGARFTKWRAVITVDDTRPSRTCIAANARALGLFAALSQEAGLVPIVEPEILMDGNHSIARCEEVTRETLQQVFDSLFEHRVVFEQMLLKTGMVLSGTDCPEQAGLEMVAEATLRCLRRAVPPAVAGIVFLSGGQSDVAATERLNAICRLDHAPWHLSFSFGRALQASTMGIWQGSPLHIAAAQEALHHRARCNSLAMEGRYSTDLDPADSGTVEEGHG